ncbi:exostosin family protein [Arcticibacter sp.]|jgi:hypothetical protein|uniref:exostosin domain-containing protein n=1 Tax=Arcticibacter sp. TaxID=1872630 RepID=UPI00388DA391
MSYDAHIRQYPAVKAFITSAYNDPEPISSFLKIAKLDKIKRHTLVDSPESADIILFVENSRYHFDSSFRALKNNYLVKKYPNKVFMYNPHDRPWFVLKGLYACIPQRLYNSNLIAATPYIETTNSFIRCDDDREPKYLFSFMGSLSSGIRKKIMKLTHPRGYLDDSKGESFGSHPISSKMQYANLLSDSKFVLCPRGFGPSSIRLFETMQAGRVPVIISDEWVSPPGLPWSDFSVFIPESSVDEIPRILEEEEVSWEAKAKLARRIWEENFAPDTLFHYCMNNLLTLKRSSRRDMDVYLRLNHAMAFLRYSFGKHVVKEIRSFLHFQK